MVFKKFITFLKSWHTIDLNKKYSSVVFGPDGSYSLRFFEDNYCYVDPLNYNIFNTKLIFRAFILFIKIFIKRPILLLKYYKLWPTIFFVNAIIKRNKIKTLIALADYNNLPIIFKKILGNDVYTVGVQNGMRGYPINRMDFVNRFDEHFLWNELSLEEKKKLNFQTKINAFGSLKSHLVIEQYNKWQTIEKYPDVETKKSLFLISSYTDFFDSFYKKYFNNVKPENFLDKIEKLENEYKKSKIKFNLSDLAHLDFLRLCSFLKNFCIKHDLTLNVICRSNPKSKYSNEEISFYNSMLDNKNILFLQDPHERIHTILNNKNSVYFTNISSLGYESFALNLKVIFCSNWASQNNANHFQKDSIFISINENQELFDSRVETILKMDSENFLKNKKFVKKNMYSVQPSIYNLKYFLKITNLQINKNKKIDFPKNIYL